MGLGQSLAYCLNGWKIGNPFASYFDVDQGWEVLTQPVIRSSSAAKRALNVKWCANLIETVDFQVFRTLFMIIPFVVTSWPMPLPRYRADHGGMYPAPLAEISSTSINFMRHMVGPKLWYSTYSTTSGNEDQVFTRLPKFTSIYQQVFTRVQGPIHMLLWCSSRWVDPAIFGTEETIAVNLWGLEVGGAHWWHINHGDSPAGAWITTDVSVCEYSTQRWFVSRCIRVASRRVPPAPSE